MWGNNTSPNIFVCKLLYYWISYTSVGVVVVGMDDAFSATLLWNDLLLTISGDPPPCAGVLVHETD
jgi:hypothetical protein